MIEKILPTKFREYRSEKQPYKIYYFNDTFVNQKDAFEVAQRYKKDDKRIKFMIFKNEIGTYSLYLTRVIQLFG